ncbi:hypothetical protein UlMin_031262 [Ulmus minor]
MWRQQAPQENPDSDQSISDEEDLGVDWPANCVSLAGSSEKKEGLELLSRLEILKGIHEGETRISNLSDEKQKSLIFEDDVVIPDSGDEVELICSSKEGLTCNSDEEVISDDEGENLLSNLSTTPEPQKFPKDAMHGFGTEKVESSYSWSAVSREAEELMHLNKSASCYSHPKKSYRGKGKAKFSFRFQSNKEGLLCSSKDESSLSLNIHEVPKRFDAKELITNDNTVAELLEDIQDEEENLPEIVPEVEALGNACIEKSMAELLDGCHHKYSPLRENYDTHTRTRGKKVKLVTKKNIYLLEDRVANSEDSAELVGSGSSSDSETSDKELPLAIPTMKKQTIVDQFQEALGSTSLNEERTLVTVHKPLRSGLFWKLQQVMQSEKERDMDFLKTFQNRASQNEPNCIYGKILARYLDGKLTVCHCSLSENFKNIARSESLEETENEGMKRTIIFNSRVCNNVDLEVGNCICIQPPWKEVQGGNDKAMILATYFSSISI